MNLKEVLDQVADGTLSTEEAQLLMASLMKSKGEGKAVGFRLKVSDKAHVLSIYGPELPWKGLHPYAEGVITLLEHADEIKAFIINNANELAWKSDEAKKKVIEKLKEEIDIAKKNWKVA